MWGWGIEEQEYELSDNSYNYIQYTYNYRLFLLKMEK